MKGLKCTVSGAKISCEIESMLVTNGRNQFECNFQFDEQWDDLTLSAVFVGDNSSLVNKGEGGKSNAYQCPIVDNKCFVPAQILQESKYFALGVVGVSDEKTYVTNMAMVNMAEGVPTEYLCNTTPAPNVWEAYMASIIQNLQEAKQAKNEAQTAAQNAQTAVETAQATAETAQTAAKNAQNFAAQAELASCNPPYIGENGNWYVWNNTKKIFENTNLIAKGDTGARGEQGIQGEKGDTGEQGIQGEKGDTGEQGIQGIKGDTGEQGIQGIKGDTGEQGIQGIKGDTGEQGIPGIKGDTGEQGIQGEKGDTGEQGIPGEKGDTGEQGIPGIKGDTGEQGIPGIKGDTGEQGIQGQDGINGTNGIDGVDGIDGQDGLTTSVTLNGTVIEQVDGNIDLGTLATSDYVDSAVEGLATSDYVDSAIEELATESYVDSAIENIDTGGSGGVFDLVIRTQDEFDAMYASDTWLGAKSVCFIGDGGELEFTRSDGQGLKIPPTVMNLQGLNGAKIHVTDFDYDSSTNKGALWYATLPEIDAGYWIDGLVVAADGIEAYGIVNVEPDVYGIRNCVNVTNCSVEVTGGCTEYGACAYGIYKCENICNCSAKAYGGGVGSQGMVGVGCGQGFSSCSYICNCVGLGEKGVQVGGMPAPSMEEPYGIYNCSYVSNSRGTLGGTNTYIDSETVSFILEEHND